MKNIARIIRIAKPLHLLLLVSAFLILSGALLGLLTPIVTRYAVDYLAQNIGVPNFNWTPLVGAIVIIAAISLLEITLSALNGRLGDHIAGKLRQLLTQQFYTHILNLPQSYFDSELSGKILNQLNRGIDIIQRFFNTSINFILPTFVEALFTIIFLFWFSAWIGFLSLVLFPVYIYLSYLSTKRWGMWEIEKNKHEDAIRGRIGEVLSNMKIVKNMSAAPLERHFVSDSLTEINRIFAKQSNWYYIYDFLRNLTLVFVITAVMSIVFVQTVQGVFTIGVLVMLLQYMNRLRISLFGISFILSQIQMTVSGSKEFFEILSIEASETNEIVRKKLHSKPQIIFNKVSFEYSKDTPTLQNVSFNFHSPETIALVGPSGAGKTTIVNLILRFYEPSQGTIYLNNTPYEKINHTYIRNHIALVFQENELFSTTIAENVAYGQKKVPENAIIEALKKARAYEFVRNLKDGIHTHVGERGVRLSGGQKQRIQIARAFLADRPILILDEATSNLDAQSEHEVQQALKSVMKGRLVIIIAHRLSTIQHADRILVIQNGSIVQEGNPRELAAQKGVYSSLIRYQLEGNKQLLKQYELI